MVNYVSSVDHPIALFLVQVKVHLGHSASWKQFTRNDADEILHLLNIFENSLPEILHLLNIFDKLRNILKERRNVAFTKIYISKGLPIKAKLFGIVRVKTIQL